jgi:cytosine/adenosine deaminase-related metal-dependent hydrolase
VPLPGLVNAHTHIYSGLAPFGMPAPLEPPRDFVQILERVWWRLDRALDEASLRASARHYVAEALLAGTTTLVDHHESPGFIEGSLDVIADACHELGMRAVLCYGATERNGGADEARRGLDECRRFVLSNDRPSVRGLVGLHASFTVSDETIRAAGRLCRDLDTVLHVHLAEDRADVLDAERRGYAGPLERLLALDALPPGSILAHGVHLSTDHVQRAMDAGCWIVQNPRSNRNNRVGYPAALGEAPRVAVGTDGFPADMLAERVALLATGTAAGDPQRSLDARCAGSLRLAAALFGEDAAGTPSDVDVESWLASRRDAARAHHEIDGRIVLDRGRLMTSDVDAIREEAAREARRLWSRLPRA